MADLVLTDALRLGLGVAAILLAATVLRLGWLRHQRGLSHRDGAPHPATLISYALALFLLAGLRLTHIGQPPVWDLWIAVVVVALGWAGVLTRVRFTHRPPWRR